MNKQQMDQVRELIRLNMNAYLTLRGDYIPVGTDGLTHQQERVFDMEMDRFIAQNPL